MRSLRSKALITCLLAAFVLVGRETSGQARGWSSRPLASNVIVPQARSLAADRESAIEITEVKVGVVILNQAATTTMDIRIRNRSKRRGEAELVVPVPGGAVVRSFAFHGAATEATAQVLPKNEANKTYEAIVAKMRDPALLEFMGYNLIRSSVFPVEAGGTQKVRLTYEHILPADGSRVDYILPRTESLDYNVPWEVSVRIKSKRPISTVYSPSHRIETTHLDLRSMHDADIPVASVVSAKIAEDARMEPGPFRLSYLLEEDGVSASLFTYPDPNVGGGYFLLLAGLPAKLPQGVDGLGIKREVSLVFDRSGSMRGEKIEQVREAALQILAGLETGEAFNIIAYNETVDLFSRRPVIKSEESVRAARAYLQSVNARGGTNIHDALLEALRQRPTEGMLPIVLFLTDGLPTVGQTSEIAIRNVAIKANPYDRRVFTFGAGVDVNTPLLEKIASETRATATFVLPKEDVEVKVSQVFKRLAGPVLASPKLEMSSAPHEWGSTGSGPGYLLASLPANDVFPATTPGAVRGAAAKGVDPSNTSSREARVRELFRSVAERKVHVDFPASEGQPFFVWSDIPILLRLAESDKVLAPMPAMAISSYIAREGREGMAALWLIEGLRRGEEMMREKEQTKLKTLPRFIGVRPPLNPTCVREGMKMAECENSAEIHQEVLNAYRKWWDAVKLLPSKEAALFDPLDLTDLAWGGGTYGGELEIYDAMSPDRVVARRVKKAWRGPVLKTVYYTLDAEKLPKGQKDTVAREGPFDKSMLTVQKVVLHFYDEKGREIRTEEYFPPRRKPKRTRRRARAPERSSVGASFARVRDVIPSKLPDLFDGDQLVLLGKYTGVEPLTFKLSGNYLGKERAFRFTFDLDEATTRNAFVPRLWASRKIGVLVDAIRQLGADVGPLPGQKRVSDDPRLAELVDEIVSLSTQFGILTEYTAFLAREGTNLSQRDQVLAEANRNFLNRAIATRSGLASVNQSFNNDFQLRQQVLNYRNSFFDRNMDRVAVATVQQMNDMAFYRRGDRWIDSRLVETEEETVSAKVIEFGSEEFRELALRLASQNRQGALSLRGGVLMMVDGEPVLVRARGAQ